MPSNKPRSRAREFEDLIDAQPTDFDPEADDVPFSEDEDGHDDDSDSHDGADLANGAREHYVDVGKSRLRGKVAEVPLGKRYEGVKVGRKGLDEEDGGSDFEGDWDDEDDSEEFEEMDGESDGEEFDEDEENESHQAPPPTAVVDEKKKAQLRDVMREERSVATSLSKATQADAEKGRAVKKQKAAFDSLLSTRIKLQKSLVDVNTIVGLDGYELDESASQAIQAAEDAAFKLWSSLNDYRAELQTSQTGQKRKRKPFASTSTPQALWAYMQGEEEHSLSQRNAVLRKWSAKTGQASALPKENGLRNGHQSGTIIDALQQHLNDTDRLLKRARTPRSCAPLQVAKKVIEDAKIYDDADFYGQLLKELLEQKSSAADSAPAAIDLDFKAIKTKRNVDTKASKGRKLRYTVHEKLQNFMAPEDRGTWGAQRADELFGSLFGRRMALGEDEMDGVNGGDINGEGEEEAQEFVMFRQ